jgi:hypothetical protein
MAQGRCWGKLCGQIVTQTCQANPEPPFELIERWQGYLNKSRNICTGSGKPGWNKKDSDADFETTWQEASADLNKPIDEAESIRYWERIIEKMAER